MLKRKVYNYKACVVAGEKFLQPEVLSCVRRSQWLIDLLRDKKKDLDSHAECWREDGGFFTSLVRNLDSDSTRAQKDRTSE